MHSSNNSSVLKRLSVDLLMTGIFLGLFAFAAWLIYIYFFRGPIAIETRGFVSRTIKAEAVDPAQVEKYRVNHFHNLDKAVLSGIQSPSLCVSCHQDYPHDKDNKTRAYLNAHSWFMACEVCHIRPGEGEQLQYRWLDPNTGKPLAELVGQAGVYGGLIIPTKAENGTVTRLDVLSDTEQAFTEEFIRKRDTLSNDEVKAANERIHKPLSNKAFLCEDCHSQKGMLDFNQLLYTEKRAMHLKSLNMIGMIKTYKDFHLPSLFDSK